MEDQERLEQQVEEYNQRVYGGEMTAHQKSVLRKQLEEENRFWDEEEGRVLKDSNRYHDDA